PRGTARRRRRGRPQLRRTRAPRGDGVPPHRHRVPRRLLRERWIHRRVRARVLGAHRGRPGRSAGGGDRTDPHAARPDGRGRARRQGARREDRVRAIARGHRPAPVHAVTTSGNDDYDTGADPIAVEADRYLDHLAVERGLSDHTLAAYRRDLRRYVRFLQRREVASLQEVDEATIRSFLASISASTHGEDERPYKATSVARTLSAVRSFHRFLL